MASTMFLFFLSALTALAREQLAWTVGENQTANEKKAVSRCISASRSNPSPHQAAVLPLPSLFVPAR